MRMSGQRHAPAVLYPLYPLDRRLGGPQSRSGQRRQSKNPFASAGDRHPVVKSVVRHCTDRAIPAPGSIAQYDETFSSTVVYGAVACGLRSVLLKLLILTFSTQSSVLWDLGVTRPELKQIIHLYLVKRSISGFLPPQPFTPMRRVI